MSEFEKRAMGQPSSPPPVAGSETHVPATVMGFLKAEKASPKAFLAQARKTPPAELSDSDFQELMAYLEAQDGAAQRLTNLMSELRDEQATVARQVTQAAEAYARRQLPVTTPWHPLRVGTSPLQVRDTVRSLLASAKEPRAKKKAEMAAYFVLWLSRLRAVIDSEALAEFVLFAFPPESSSRARQPNNSPRDLGAILTRILHKRGAREPVLETALHFAAKSDAAAKEVQALNEKVERLKEEITKDEATIEALTQRSQGDRRLLEEKERRISALTQDINDHRAVARQSSQRVKARINGLLKGELLELMRDVHDSATMEPVRTHIILDRIETARKIIEKESQWLESSD